MFALFGSPCRLCVPFGQGLGLAPRPEKVLDGTPRPAGAMAGTGSNPAYGTCSHFLGFFQPPQPGLDYFLVAKEAARRWKERRKVLRNTRSIWISFSSAFLMLNPPSTAAPESSPEPVCSPLGRGVKVSGVTTGKRINIYQVPAMHGPCFRFVCRLCLTCAYL